MPICLNKPAKKENGVEYIFPFSNILKEILIG